MKHKKWQAVLGIALVFSSTALYFIHYLLFHDAHHILIYLVGDIAFVPIEVLLVTLIIHKLLEEREKKAIYMPQLQATSSKRSSACSRSIIAMSCPMLRLRRPKTTWHFPVFG